MTKPLVSIIIPYYNRPEKIVRCINSVFKQKYTNYEIIVVDDCSEKPYHSVHETIRVIRNKTNLGPGISRNNGKKIARGEFISFLDSDDYWHPNFLYKIIPPLLANPQACMAYSKVIKMDESNEILGARRTHSHYPTTILPKVLYKGRQWGTSSCVWRYSSINKIDFLKYRNWEDYVFDIEVGVHNNYIIPVEKPLVYYDASGNDKLSKQDHSFQFKEKNKSLCYASALLSTSNYKKDEGVKKHITLLLVLNLIKLKKHKVNDRVYYTNAIRQLQLWRPKRFVLWVWMLTTLNNRISVRYLNSLKKRIAHSTLPFFLR